MTQVENESCYKIQVIKSDNDKEYTSTTFNQFCEESGIYHQLTASYTPQQSDDTSPKQKDDNIGGKNTDEESKLLRAYSVEAS